MQRRMVPPAVVVAATKNRPPAAVVATTKNGPPAAVVRVQAGTGCHEGGIILSKKPPEWHLSPPYQRSASESNLFCGKVEWFRLPQSSRLRRIVRLLKSSRQRRIARLPQSFGVQAGTGCHEGGIILSKKPPEWRLSPPYQRSASESNLLCRNNVLRPKLIFVASTKGRYAGWKAKVEG